MGGKHYLPATKEDREAMLASIGIQNIEELFADIPSAVRLAKNLFLPAAMDELTLTAHLRKVAARNTDID